MQILSSYLGNRVGRLDHSFAAAFLLDGGVQHDGGQLVHAVRCRDDFGGAACVLARSHRDLLGQACHVLGHLQGPPRGLGLALGVQRALFDNRRSLVDRRHHPDQNFVGQGHGRAHVFLHALDDRSDVLRGLGAALGEPAHLIGHHGKAPPGLARARRLDGGVERQQVGLIRDFLN